MVRLDMDALDSAAGQVSSIASNFATEMAQLVSLASATKEYWDDPVQVSFEAKVTEFNTSMTNFIEALNNTSSVMAKHASNQREILAAGSKALDSI